MEQRNVYADDRLNYTHEISRDFVRKQENEIKLRDSFKSASVKL